jgi:hypothetical protein
MIIPVVRDGASPFLFVAELTLVTDATKIKVLESGGMGPFDVLPVD